MRSIKLPIFILTFFLSLNFANAGSAPPCVNTTIVADTVRTPSTDLEFASVTIQGMAFRFNIPITTYSSFINNALTGNLPISENTEGIALCFVNTTQYPATGDPSTWTMSVPNNPALGFTNDIYSSSDDTTQVPSAYLPNGISNNSIARLDLGGQSGGAYLIANLNLCPCNDFNPNATGSPAPASGMCDITPRKLMNRDSLWINATNTNNQSWNCTANTPAGGLMIDIYAPKGVIPYVGQYWTKLYIGIIPLN